MKLNVACPRTGDAMNMIRAGTDSKPPITASHIFFVHTAVLKGAAAFFYSTHFPFLIVHIPKYGFVLEKSVSAVWQVRFFFVVKSLFLTFFNPRAPPSDPEFSILKNFRTGGNLNEN